MVDINYILSFSSVKLDRHYTYGYILPSTFFDKKILLSTFWLREELTKRLELTNHFVKIYLRSKLIR